MAMPFTLISRMTQGWSTGKLFTRRILPLRITFCRKKFRPSFFEIAKESLIAIESCVELSTIPSNRSSPSFSAREFI